MTRIRKITAVLVALALAVVIAGAAFAAGGGGTTALNLITGGQGQQGTTLVTGDCQTGDLNVSFQAPSWDPNSNAYVYKQVIISGIDAACVTGAFTILDPNGAYINTLTIVPDAGEWAGDGNFPVGGIGRVAVALFGN